MDWAIRDIALMAGLLEFEWDTRKAGVNLAKHGVSFEEARGVFSGPKALAIPDPDHSRWRICLSSWD